MGSRVRAGCAGGPGRVVSWATPEQVEGGRRARALAASAAGGIQKHNRTVRPPKESRSETNRTVIWTPGNQKTNIVEVKELAPDRWQVILEKVY